MSDELNDPCRFTMRVMNRVLRAKHDRVGGLYGRPSSWRWLHAGGGVLLCLLLLCASSFGCGEVEHCTPVTELGCLNSAPTMFGTCLYDLVLRKGICVRPGSDEDKCGDCPEGNLCIPERNECRNFCEVPAILPGSVSPPPAIFCTAVIDPAKPTENPMLSFEEVCTRRCRLQCQRWESFCGDFRCAEGYCDRPEEQAKCVEECPPTGTVRDLACLTQKCDNTRRSVCDSDMQCPNAFKVDCTNITCSNNCMYEGNKGAAGDGFCDDGDPINADSASCAWGTDCIDCGPRTGTKKEPSYVGDVCGFNLNCEGWTGSPLTSKAWCIGLSIPGLARCTSDCSRADPCQDGFECRELTFKNAQNEDVMLVEGGLSAKACFPTMCL